MINVTGLKIKNVTQKDWNKVIINISFELNAGWYQLQVIQNKKGVFHPITIFHIKYVTRCPYCGSSGVTCEKLNLYKNELFYRLIEYPSIRMEWLYLPHVEQA